MLNIYNAGNSSSYRSTRIQNIIGALLKNANSIYRFKDLLSVFYFPCLTPLSWSRFYFILNHSMLDGKELESHLDQKMWPNALMWWLRLYNYLKSLTLDWTDLLHWLLNFARGYNVNCFPHLSLLSLHRRTTPRTWFFNQTQLMVSALPCLLSTHSSVWHPGPPGTLTNLALNWCFTLLPFCHFWGINSHPG